MKDCLIIGATTALTYKDVYPLLRDKVLKVGIWTVGWETEKGRAVGRWFSTLNPIIPEEKKLKLAKTYNRDDYPRFDNDPDIIESKSKDIPVEYDGLIAVPITFFNYYGYLPYEVIEHRGDLKLNGKTVYERLIIRR
jgi:hypothetical protein